MAYSLFDFTLNNSEFTEKYCENKYRPALKCNGKCKLAKIAKENEKNNSGKSTSQEKEIEFLFQPFDTVEFIVLSPVKKQIRTKCDLHNFNSFQDNFHPPKNCFSFS